jgi:hypothetical protein
MRTNQRAAGIRMSLAALVMSLLYIGTVQAQIPVYRGQFTLPYQVHWGKSVLEPGDYTITIQSAAIPTIALITTADGKGGTHVVTGVHGEPTKGVNALLLKDKDGQLTVHSLSLADLRMALIYDPPLARESDQEARVSRTVTVMWPRSSGTSENTRSEGGHSCTNDNGASRIATRLHRVLCNGLAARASFAFRGCTQLSKITNGADRRLPANLAKQLNRRWKEHSSRAFHLFALAREPHA